MRHFVSISLLCASIALAGCSSGSGRSLLALEDEKAEIRAAIAARVGVPQDEVVQAFDTTEAQQQKNAAALKHKLMRRYGTSPDVAMQRHLQGVVNRLALGINAADVPFELVLLRSGQANASTPGAGVLFVNEGLLRFADTEAQVAAVLAHEMAHVLMRHPQRQKQIHLAGKAGSKMMDGLTDGGKDEGFFSSMLRLSGNATMNGMIRQQEMMADSIGLDMLVKAGYEPRALLAILQKLRATGPQRDRLTNVVYGNHPLTEDREKAVVAKIARSYAHVSGRNNSPQYVALARPYQLRKAKRLAAMRTN